MKGRLLTLLISICALMSTAQEERPRVMIESDSGNIVIELYNETPLHRDNFLKLAREGFYDGTMFHRVIQNFMIQGGDPKSKEEGATNLGSGGPGYTIPAEINKSFYHKKGALCAARQGDNMNPKRESSGSQFYIVQGALFDSTKLARFEMNINQDLQQQIVRAFYMAPENQEYLERLKAAQKERDQQALEDLSNDVEPLIMARFNEKKFSYSQEQRDVYATTGGTPHLDMQYTVFGEVVEGLEVVDKIASVPKEGERPTTPLRMTVKVLD